MNSHKRKERSVFKLWIFSSSPLLANFPFHLTIAINFRLNSAKAPSTLAWCGLDSHYLMFFYFAFQEISIVNFSSTVHYMHRKKIVKDNGSLELASLIVKTHELVDGPDLISVASPADGNGAIWLGRAALQPTADEPCLISWKSARRAEINSKTLSNSTYTRFNVLINIIPKNKTMPTARATRDNFSCNSSMSILHSCETFRRLTLIGPRWN